MKGVESVAHMPAGESKKPAKKLASMEVEEAKNGGHTVTHRFTSYEHKPEQNVFGKEEGNEMLAHIAKHAHVEHSLKPSGAEEQETAENELGANQKETEA